MKKFFFCSLIFISLGVLPLSGFANTNPFLQLVQKATTVLSGSQCKGDPDVGICAPGAGSNFCSCFWEQMKKQCPKYAPVPTLCKNKAWAKAQIAEMTIPYLCKNFPTGGADFCWCQIELSYFYHKC